MSSFDLASTFIVGLNDYPPISYSFLWVDHTCYFLPWVSFHLASLLIQKKISTKPIRKRVWRAAHIEISTIRFDIPQHSKASNNFLGWRIGKVIIIFFGCVCKCFKKISSHVNDRGALAKRITKLISQGRTFSWFTNWAIRVRVTRLPRAWHNPRYAHGPRTSTRQWQLPGAWNKF